MGAARSRGSEARSGPSRSEVMRAELPRDPITGTRAAPYAQHKSMEGMSSREIEEEIRRTRARMSGTLEAIEERISPARIKSEIQETFHETMDDVRERFHPQRVAKRAGDNMLDTVREHPMPALIAGLSIGYMFMKGRSDHGAERSERFGARRFGTSEPWDYRFEEEWYRDQVYPSRHPEYPAQYASEEEGSRARQRVEDVKSRAVGAARRAGEEADDALQTARRRADDTLHGARDKARRARRKIRREAYRAEHTLEDFVHENPLMAGLVAAGAGALLGSLLPPTEFEDRRMGGMRDELMEEASETAREAKERAKHVAEDAREELQESGRRVVESATSEARQMAGSSEEAAYDREEGSLAPTTHDPESTTSEPTTRDPRSTTSEQTRDPRSTTSEQTRDPRRAESDQTTRE